MIRKKMTVVICWIKSRYQRKGNTRITKNVGKSALKQTLRNDRVCGKKQRIQWGRWTQRERQKQEDRKDFIQQHFQLFCDKKFPLTSLTAL